MTKLTKTFIDNYLASQGTSREEITEFVIPDHINNTLLSYFHDNNTTEIGYFAFYECSALKYITIPDSVTKIDSRAFVGCTSLTHIICNNPDAFRYQRFPTDHQPFDGKDNKLVYIATQDAQSHNQMKFISTTNLLENSYPSG